jgi:hypothetical protein
MEPKDLPKTPETTPAPSPTKSTTKKKRISRDVKAVDDIRVIHQLELLKKQRKIPKTM